MRFNEFEDSDYEIHDRRKLDRILLELCNHVIKGQKNDPLKYGMVAACVLDPKNRKVFGVNEAAEDGTRKHAERVAIDRYVKNYGDMPNGSIIITTLSPCNEDDTEMAANRYGESCTDLVNESNVRKVYCGYMDPTQDDKHNQYTLEETSNPYAKSLCKKFADTFLEDYDPDVEEGWKDIAAAGALATGLAFGGGNADAKLPTKPPVAHQQVQNVTGTSGEELLRKTAKAAGIQGTELTAFLSQCAHETLNFTRLKEFGGKLDFRKYDPKYAPAKAKRLGNTQVGDGAKYKGRGFIHLTGRYNYKKAGEALGLPLEKNPEMVENPNIAAKVAVWFWQNRVKHRVAGGDYNDVQAVTKSINPGLKHLDRRQEKFDTFKVASR
jgi:putative chitinase